MGGIVSKSVRDISILLSELSSLPVPDKIIDDLNIIKSNLYYVSTCVDPFIEKMEVNYDKRENSS